MRLAIFATASSGGGGGRYHQQFMIQLVVSRHLFGFFPLSIIGATSVMMCSCNPGSYLSMNEGTNEEQPSCEPCPLGTYKVN